MDAEDNVWIERQVEYWDTIAKDYDSLYQNRWSTLENNQTLQQLNSLPVLRKKDPRILDIGCGTGLGYEFCSKVIGKRFEYVGIDISPEMIRVCKDKWGEATFYVENMGNLSSFPDDYYDLVVCLFSAFSYTNYPRKALDEFFRVTKVGGMVFVSVLSRFSLRRVLKGKFGSIEDYSTRHSLGNTTAPAHVYSKSEIVSLFEIAGFSGLRIQGQGVFSGLLELPPLWNIDRRLALRFTNLCHIMNIYAEKQERQHGR